MYLKLNMFGKQMRGYKMPDRMVGDIRCSQSAVNFLMEAICDFYRDSPKLRNLSQFQMIYFSPLCCDFVLHAIIGTCLYTYFY